jgi:hypothetical protein
MATNYRGHNSYANLLEKRIITCTWVAWASRTQGRFTFQRMFEPTNENQWNANVIGHEMVSYRAGRSRWDRGNGSVWIFRSYLDGVALYKPNLLRQYVRGWSCCHAIDEVVYDNFYVDAQIENGHYYDRVKILRRKPLSHYGRMAVQRENDLGEFLVRKYNLGGERETVSC